MKPHGENTMRLFCRMYIVNLVGSECIGIRAATPTAKARHHGQQTLNGDDIDILLTILRDHHGKHKHPTIPNHQVRLRYSNESEPD